MNGEKQKELAYLEETIAVIQKERAKELAKQSKQKKKVIDARRDMWENAAPFSGDFALLTEMNQYLLQVNQETAGYQNTVKQIEDYNSIIDTPYFGRFDFAEESCGPGEKIYIGLHTVTDSQTHQVYVYDWRAPIASIFYRYEPGRAAYNAPAGLIHGDLLLKRQYKIRNSKLIYFFDCNRMINDEMLQEILSCNASVKMKNIVETIQKEQDLIIRNRDHDLLMVQGVAGSGKTSIALHRIAFLLYDGLKSKLASHNIMIISPNPIFSRYISDVLPGLGEENVEQATFEDIAARVFADRFRIETRAMQLESMIYSCRTNQGNARRQSADFKGSKTFVKILDRLLRHYARHMIPFADVYYDGLILETRQQLKNRFLNNKTGIPMAKQLQRIENWIWQKVHPLQKKRLKKIEKIVASSEGHDLEIRSFSRLMSIKEAASFRKRLHKFTRVDYLHLYERLFDQPKLFFKLSQGLDLPENIEQILSSTREGLQRGQVHYEDGAPLLYLKLRMEGHNLFPEIQQVVIDEAQDYAPLQYEVFKLLFPEAKYTVLGDIRQTIEKEADPSLYDDISAILDKEKSITLQLNKAYRSSYEINTFAQRLLGLEQNRFFERHDKEPLIVPNKTEQSMDRAIRRAASDFLGQGFESVAILCKTQREAERVYHKLKEWIPVKLIHPQEGKVEKGLSVIASYISKGLEFDVVMVYGANKGNYSSDLDKKLLYVACTRALHRLAIYYTGEKCPFI
ncbi:HelD family protein [Desulforamulus ruminis]|uniref:HelD family protein n=1 Tax=Desulforamulus ruminis TaxID=1564 RepID=UPI0023552BD8|nr:3'-5' exonuclease [Desulforamulus ruminis]